MNRKNEIPTANNKDSITEQFQALIDIIRILRKDCPWDSRQTNESIAHLLIEEAYETLDSIYKKNDADFSKELGDLMLHIIMHAVMAEERQAFTLLDVLVKIQNKLVARHPHVFGDVTVSGEEEVVQNWEALKMKEGQKSILQGVPDSLPALLRAQRIQHKASKVGFDWTERDDVWEKIYEELEEFRKEVERKNFEGAREELGDILFSIVNAARFDEIVAEEALQLTNNKFTERFQFIEKKAAEQNKKLTEMTLREMDAIWDEAKAKEKTA